ncbi:hypothetical protein FQN54_000091 [Arachnomyces sp. PD_36]|nr:hypothetical protein FQN54_000091 [Arachnomyces sp. PD_36]
MRLLTSSLIAFGILSTEALAKGINCDGSGACAGFNPPEGWAGSHTIDQVVEALKANLQDDREYTEGSQLACVESDGGPGAICAFIQGTEGKSKTSFSGFDIKWLAQALIDHGCKDCGSIPILQSDDVHSDGMLTINYVSEVKTPGGFECDDFTQFNAFEGKGTQSPLDTIVEKLGSVIPSEKDETMYPNDQAIYCLGGTGVTPSFGHACVIPRNTQSGIKGYDVKVAADTLRNHGCTVGGKIASDSGANIDANGSLNVEWFENDCPYFAEV